MICRRSHGQGSIWPPLASGLRGDARHGHGRARVRGASCDLTTDASRVGACIARMVADEVAVGGRVAAVAAVIGVGVGFGVAVVIATAAGSVAVAVAVVGMAVVPGTGVSIAHCWMALGRTRSRGGEDST
jgi:hypothetical protein